MAVPEFVYNQDVEGAYRRINRIIGEMSHATSSSVSLFNEFDMARIKSYLDNLDGYLDWVVGQPAMDYPETYPTQYTLQVAPDIPTDLENEEIQTILNMTVAARDELVNSQSARQGSGIIPFDLARIKASIVKLNSFLDNYVATLTPLDLPETSPMAGISGPGAGGV